MRLYNLLQTVRTSEGITQEAVLAVVGRKRKDSTVRKQDDAVEYRGAEALPINRQQQGDGVCNTLAIDMAYVEDEPSTPNNSQRVNQGHGSQRGSSGRKYYASVALGSKPVSAHCAVGGCNSDAVIMCMQENCGAPVCCKHVHKDLIFSYVYCPTCWGEWWYRTIVPTRWPLFRKLFL